MRLKPQEVHLEVSHWTDEIVAMTTAFLETDQTVALADIVLVFHPDPSEAAVAAICGARLAAVLLRAAAGDEAQDMWREYLAYRNQGEEQ